MVVLFDLMKSEAVEVWGVRFVELPDLSEIVDTRETKPYQAMLVQMWNWVGSGLEYRKDTPVSPMDTEPAGE